MGNQTTSAFTEEEHAFGERYKLMWYACECGHRERIWNSRNGVTPFCIACPSCGHGSLSHVDWQLDESAPEHTPHCGQQFFRDGTPDEAVEAIERRIKLFAEQGHSIPENVQKELLEDARNTTGEWRRGWPTVDRCAVKRLVPLRPKDPTNA